MTSTLATRLALASLLLAMLSGCGSKCDGSNCGGCCSAAGVCEVPSDSACGEGGATCTPCDAIQACLSGVCVLQSQTNGNGSTASTTGTPTTSSNTTSTSQSTSTSSPTTSTGATTNAIGTTGQSSGATSTSTTGSPTTSTSGSLTSGSPGSSTTSSSGSFTSATSSASSSSSSSSSGGTGGTLPICSPCSLNTQCASGYCDNATPPGFCDTSQACNPAGGDGSVSCSPYSCGADGNCVCPGESTTGSSGTTGCSCTACTALGEGCDQANNCACIAATGSGSTGTTSCAASQICAFCTILNEPCEPPLCTCSGLTGGLTGTTGGLGGTLGSSSGTGTSGSTGACPDTAIQLTGPGSNVEVSGDTVNGADTLTSSCDEAGIGAPLVGYTFTLAETADIFATATTTTTGYSPLISLGTGCSNGAYTENYCSNSQGAEATFFSVVDLAPGTYELLVSGDDADGLTGSSGPYVLHAWAAAQENAPFNDQCSGATALSLATFADAGMGASISVNNFWAFNTTTSSVSGACLGNGRGPNLVYSLDLPDAASGITATLVPGDDGGLNEPVVSIQESPCEQNNSTDAGTLTSELACADWTMAGGAVAHVATTVRAGTYYIWVDEYDTGVPGEGTLTVTIP